MAARPKRNAAAKASTLLAKTDSDAGSAIEHDSADDEDFQPVKKTSSRGSKTKEISIPWLGRPISGLGRLPVELAKEVVYQCSLSNILRLRDLMLTSRAWCALILGDQQWERRAKEEFGVQKRRQKCDWFQTWVETYRRRCAGCKAPELSGQPFYAFSPYEPTLYICSRNGCRYKATWRVFTASDMAYAARIYKEFLTADQLNQAAEPDPKDNTSLVWQERVLAKMLRKKYKSKTAEMNACLDAMDEDEALRAADIIDSLPNAFSASLIEKASESVFAEQWMQILASPDAMVKGDLSYLNEMDARWDGFLGAAEDIIDQQVKDPVLRDQLLSHLLKAADYPCAGSKWSWCQNIALGDKSLTDFFAFYMRMVKLHPVSYPAQGTTTLKELMVVKEEDVSRKDHSDASSEQDEGGGGDVDEKPDSPVAAVKGEMQE